MLLTLQRAQKTSTTKLGLPLHPFSPPFTIGFQFFWQHHANFPILIYYFDHRQEAVHHSTIDAMEFLTTDCNESTIVVCLDQKRIHISVFRDRAFRLRAAISRASHNHAHAAVFCFSR